MMPKSYNDDRYFENEHTVGTPNLVDMSEFLTHKRDIESSSTSNRQNLKPLRTPIITKRFYKPKGQNGNITLPKPQFNPRNKVIYIKYFNDVKNEITQPYREMQHRNSVEPPSLSKKKKRKGQLNPISSTHLSATIDFFKKNMKKYNPTIIKKPEKPEPPSDDDDSQDGDFAFLTGVRIKGEKKEKPKEEETVPDNESPEYMETMSEGEEPVHELPTIEHKHEARSTVSTSSKFNKLLGQGVDTKLISTSEANYEKMKKVKPKIYISARANSIQPVGRPVNYKDHLVRIYGKEATPIVPYNINNQFGSKKDLRKQLMDAYLGDFNLDALKYSNAALYEQLTNANKEDDNKANT